MQFNANILLLFNYVYYVCMYIGRKREKDRDRQRHREEGRDRER